MLSKRVGVLLILASVGAFAAFFMLRPLPPQRALEAFVAALDGETDEAAYAWMSARYRSDHDLSDFRRAIAGASELRSAEGVAVRGRAPLFDTRERVDVCTQLLGVDARLRVRLLRDDDGWRIDGLRVGERELDPRWPFEGTCAPTD